MRIIDKTLSDKVAKTTIQNNAVGLICNSSFELTVPLRLHQKLHWDDLQTRRSTKLLSQFLIYKIQKGHWPNLVTDVIYLQNFLCELTEVTPQGRI